MARTLMMRPAAGFSASLAALCLLSAVPGCSQQETGNPQRLAAANLRLTVLPESWSPGGTAGAVVLEPRLTGSQLVCTVTVTDAQDLKALYYELDYDAAGFELISARPLPAFAEPEATPYLAVETSPGHLCAGQVLPDYAAQPGFSGSAALAELRLQAVRNGSARSADAAAIDSRRYPLLLDISPPAALALRQASTAPFSDDSRASLSLDLAGQELNWGYSSAGDCDQNSEVNIADLSPLGLYLNQTGPFDPDSPQAIVDGDHNGEINLADLSVIGANFQCRVLSYDIFASLNVADAPKGNTDPDSLVPLANLPFAAGSSPGAGQRLQFSFALASLPADTYYWVRPRDDSAEPGTPSNIVDSSGLVLQRPNAALSVAPPIGPTPLNAFLDASESADADGSIVSYQWDFDNDGTIDEDGGAVNTVNHVYEADGTYTASVLVTDDSGLSDKAQRRIVVRVNQNPIAVLDADSFAGTAPLLISFNADDSSDPDGDIIAHYRWDFDGDGSFEIPLGQQTRPQYEYTQPGVYFCQLVVEDSFGGTGSSTVIITVQ